MNKNYKNGVIKSVPKKWSEEEINLLLNHRKKNKTFKEISTLLNRTYISVKTKTQKISKKNQTYNEKYRTQKYQINKIFIENTQAKTILDLYAGNSYYKKLKIKTTDNDIKPGCQYQMKAIELLTKLRKKKYDVVDLDPFGSAFECFDLAIQIAQKGIIITFGEYGHRRWNRSDFVEHRYNIKTLKEFNSQKFIDYIKQRGLIFKKDISKKYILKTKNIIRIYFLINKKQQTLCGKKYFIN